MLLSEVQFLNAWSYKVIMLFPIVALWSFVQPSNTYEFSSSSPLPKVTEVIPVFAKAEFFIAVTLSGITKLPVSGTFLNASSPIVFIIFGRTSDVNTGPSTNARVPIEDTLVRVTLFSAVQYWNAYSPIAALLPIMLASLRE